MRSIRLISVFATLLFASFAFGQTQPRVQQPPPAAKVGPYKAVSVTPPQAISDATFETFRKQMNEAAQRKDRGALTKLVVAQDFFRLRENGDRADNLAAALGLNNKDGAGWDMLASFTDDPTGSPLPERKGALCAPADPTFDGKAFNDRMQATQTDVGDWTYPATRDVEVRAIPQPNAPVIEKLGMILLRAMPEDGSNISTFSNRHAGRLDPVTVVDSWLRSRRPDLCRAQAGGRSVVISAAATHNSHEF
jgi:hypothetical protein